jgi:hypothetical protein
LKPKHVFASRFSKDWSLLEERKGLSLWLPRSQAGSPPAGDSEHQERSEIGSLEALCNYRNVRVTSTGLAVDEPVHDWASHASDAMRNLAEADMTDMLGSAGSTANFHRRRVTLPTGFPGDAWEDPGSSDSILDRFFGKPRRNVRVIR